MNIDFAFLCDHAEAGDKLHALGIGFDTIYAREAPAVHPHFCLVAQLRTSVAEAGEKQMSVRLIDPDGADVIQPMSGGLTAGRPPQGSMEQVTRMVLGFNNTRFARFGPYSLHVVVQGQEMVRLPLRIAQAAQAQPPPQRA